jgi:hypothetical protein
MAVRQYVPGMFKTVISPVQQWLISQGLCGGCGMPLSKATKGKGKKGLEIVTCKCGRIFAHNKKDNSYRRALLEEV